MLWPWVRRAVQGFSCSSCIPEFRSCRPCCRNGGLEDRMASARPPSAEQLDLGGTGILDMGVAVCISGDHQVRELATRVHRL